MPRRASAAPIRNFPGRDGPGHASRTENIREIRRASNCFPDTRTASSPHTRAFEHRRAAENVRINSDEVVRLHAGNLPHFAAGRKSLNGDNGFELRTLFMAEKRAEWTDFSELNFPDLPSLGLPGLFVVILLNFFRRRGLWPDPVKSVSILPVEA